MLRRVAQRAARVSVSAHAGAVRRFAHAHDKPSAFVCIVIVTISCCVWRTCSRVVRERTPWKLLTSLRVLLEQKTAGSATMRPTAARSSARAATRSSRSTARARATTLRCSRCASPLAHTLPLLQTLARVTHTASIDHAHSPKNFSLEQRKMEQTYWNLQKRLHPDLYGSKSDVRTSSFNVSRLATHSLALCSLRRSSRP